MDSIVLTSERHLGVGSAQARAAVIRSLRAQEFTLTGEQVSSVGAKRGSQVLGSVQPKKLPITVKVTFHPDGDGCLLVVRLADAWRSGVGKVWGLNAPYRHVLEQVQRHLDDELTPIAVVGADFSVNEVATGTPDNAILTKANVIFGRAGSAVVDKADGLLDGPSVGTAPKSLEEVVLRSPRGTATLDRAGVQGLFTVGLLVSRAPGSMPANLARDVEALSGRLETAVSAHPEGRLVIEVSEGEVPVAEFLGQQAAIREKLPQRTLQVCTTCKFEKVVNPDFQKLQDRNRRKQVLTSAVGATVSKSGISPFFLVGTMLKLKNADNPFVCPRCQGLEADMSVVTYCPQCGERRGEPVLRRCQRCKHNFGPAGPSSEEFWGPEETPALGAPPVLALTSGSATEPPQRERPVAPTAALAPPLPISSGWYADTTGRHQHRYWDGARWTSFVADNGVPAHDAP